MVIFENLFGKKPEEKQEEAKTDEPTTEVETPEVTELGSQAPEEAPLLEQPALGPNENIEQPETQETSLDTLLQSYNDKLTNAKKGTPLYEFRNFKATKVTTEGSYKLVVLENKFGHITTISEAKFN